MRRLVFALLSTFSLAACAQSSTPTADGGQKITVGSNAPAATKPIAEPQYAAGTPEAHVREVLRGINPKIRVDSIEPAPVAGFREVVAGGQVVYVSDDGKYLFQGGLLDVARRKDMAEVALARVRNDVLKTLPMADRIIYTPTGKTRHKVVVLTDVECGYCRKFHSEIAEYTKRGIEVEYLAFPRAGIGSVTGSPGETLRLPVVARLAASVPTPGSVSPNVATLSPRSAGTRYSWRRSSEPYLKTK